MGRNENLVESASRKLVDGFYSDKKQEEKAVLQYGLSALLSTIIGFVVIGVVSGLLGIFKLAMTATLVSGVIRLFAGGVHSSTYKQCVTTGGIVFTGLGLITQQLGSLLSNRGTILLVWLVFIGGGSLIYRYAPAGVKEKPIKSKDKQRKLRVYSFIIFFIITTVALMLLSFEVNKLIALAMLLGAIWELFTITPIAYRLFRREYIRR